MVKFILRLIRPFRKLLEWAGVNYPQFEVILGAKLTMDNRKMLGNNSQKKTLKNAMLMQIFIYGMIGGFMSTMLIRGSNALFFFSTIFFSFIMIMVIMGLIAEFNTILFDTRDNSILLPRPIAPRTLLFVRVMHIMIYLMLISLSLSIIPLIVFAFMFGVPAMLLLLTDVILITLFSVFLTNIIYLLLMKLTTGERLKDIITYSQIVMAIIFMGAYQFMPRLAENQALMSGFNQLHWWMYLVPPFWMSASITPIINGGFSIQSAGFLLLSLAMPLIGLWLVSSVLAKNFNQSLSTLDQGDTKSDKKKGKAETSSLLDFLSRICSYTAEERVSFATIWRITNRDRKFKQAVYPGLGYIFIIIIMTFVNSRTPLSEIGETKKYLILIYAPAFILNVLIYTIRYSENFKASWIYQTIPVQYPGELLSGAFKAIFTQLFLPVYVVANIVTIYFWGYPVIIDVIYGFCSILMMAYVMLLVQPAAFPFSDEKSSEQSGRNVMTSMLMLLAIGAMAGIHYLLIAKNINLLFVLPVILLVLFSLSRKYRLTPWHKMVKVY
jgi:ABC-2 type transport system permease protein